MSKLGSFKTAFNTLIIIYMTKQMIDFNASAGMSTNQSNEHHQRWSDRCWNVAVKGDNYDRTRAHLNFEVPQGGVV